MFHATAQAAETGSGKTGAFSLPIIQIVHETKRMRREGKGGKRRVEGSSGAGSQSVILNPFDRGELFGQCTCTFICMYRSDYIE